MAIITLLLVLPNAAMRYCYMNMYPESEMLPRI